MIAQNKRVGGQFSDGRAPGKYVIMLKTITPLDTFTWTTVHNMTPGDREKLNNEFGIDNELINYAIDPYESARMEYDDVKGVTLMIIDVVTPTSTIATTEPVGLMFTNDMQHFLSFTREETSYVTDYLRQIIEELRQRQAHDVTPISLSVNVIVLIAAKFLAAILEINRRRMPIQREMRHVKNTQAQIDILMDLQTDLIYILNSLQTDIDLLRGFTKNHRYSLTENNLERIEDALVELVQALDTGQLSQKVTKSVSDSYSDLSNNRLNWTMKVLTVSSIVLTMPTIITGFFGQNVSLPFAHTPFGWVITIFICLLFMAAVTWLFWWMDFLKK